MATILSVGFWAIGLPYWLLVGAFAGLVEIVPVIGPLVAAIVAIGVGLSVSTHLAVIAGLLVLGVRLLEDYVIIPRVLGHSVGVSPLLVLVSVTTVGVVFGGFAVILAVPLASIIVTLFDIVVRDKDPAEEEVPSVIFPAQDSSRHDINGRRRSTPWLHAAILIRSDVRPEVSRATVDVSPGSEAPAAAIDQKRGGSSRPAARVEVYSPDVICATCRSATTPLRRFDAPGRIRTATCSRSARRH